MGCRSSLPTPRERSNSDSSRPPSLLWSPWLELSATIIKYQSSHSIPILNLSISSLSLQVVSDQVTADFLSKHLPYYFPFFPMNFLNSIPPEWFFSGKYLSNLTSIHWVLLKDCLGIFGLVVIYWATCSNPTFLGDHDPNYREVATCNLGSVWGCCHLSFALHLVPSTSLTSNLLLTALPCCCLHFLFINNKIFRITFHFFWLCWVISS